MAEILSHLNPILKSNPYVIIESNGIVQHVRPSLYLMVHRYDVEDYKDSARQTIRRADAVVAMNYDKTGSAWKESFPDIVSRIPVFPVPHRHVLTQSLIEFIRLRLD